MLWQHLISTEDGCKATTVNNLPLATKERDDTDVIQLGIENKKEISEFVIVI